MDKGVLCGTCRWRCVDFLDFLCQSLTQRLEPIRNLLRLIHSTILLCQSSICWSKLGLAWGGMLSGWIMLINVLWVDVIWSVLLGSVEYIE